MGMVRNWHELGILVKEAGAENYFESERQLPARP
jgi:hypothetical protein